MKTLTFYKNNTLIIHNAQTPVDCILPILPYAFYRYIRYASGFSCVNVIIRVVIEVSKYRRGVHRWSHYAAIHQTANLHAANFHTYEQESSY